MSGSKISVIVGLIFCLFFLVALFLGCPAGGGADYLHTYWLGRYYGVIGEDD